MGKMFQFFFLCPQGERGGDHSLLSSAPEDLMMSQRSRYGNSVLRVLFEWFSQCQEVVGWFPYSWKSNSQSTLCWMFGVQEYKFKHIACWMGYGGARTQTGALLGVVALQMAALPTEPQCQPCKVFFFWTHYIKIYLILQLCGGEYMIYEDIVV